MLGFNTVFLIVFRVLMGILILFELLNGFSFLKFYLVYTWQWLVVVAFIAWVSAEIIMKRKKEVLAPLLFSLLSVAVFLDFFWDFLHWYASVPYYDKFLHFFNSGVITYLIFVTLKDRIGYEKMDTLSFCVSLVSLGSFFWILYEVEEFLEDVLINKRQLRLGDGYDTVGDMLMNILWCTLMTLFILNFLYKKQPSTPIEIPMPIDMPIAQTPQASQVSEGSEN